MISITVWDKATSPFRGKSNPFSQKIKKSLVLFENDATKGLHFYFSSEFMWQQQGGKTGNKTQMRPS